MRIYSLTINNNNYNVAIKKISDEDIQVEVNGIEHLVTINDIKHINQAVPEITQSRPKKIEPSVSQIQPASPSSAGICSPIPGHILKICVDVGDKVSFGQKLLVLEAMKLENIINSDRDGLVKKILVKEGDSVTHDQALIIVE